MAISSIQLELNFLSSTQTKTLTQVGWSVIRVRSANLGLLGGRCASFFYWDLNHRHLKMVGCLGI